LGTHSTQDRPAAVEDLQKQLTFSGHAEQPAISPDGRFVAYVSESALWIQQTATSSNDLKVPAEAGVELRGVTVTSDNNSVDFVRVPSAANSSPSLWRVPLIGGAPKLLIDNVYSPPGWSPDGRRMAFIRSNATANPAALVIADADGKNERVLATLQRP